MRPTSRFCCKRVPILNKLPLLVTPGEPAGIGPELAVAVAAVEPGLVLVADPDLLEAAAARSSLDAGSVDIEICEWHPGAPAPAGDGRIGCLPVALAAPATAGRLNRANAGYVLETLETAADAVRAGDAAALVTGPVHKAIINDAGFEFTGHTEFLAARAGVERVVMMLVADRLRVALATTHLPLARVPGAIDAAMLEQTITILDRDLRARFGLAEPRIAVLGLNPHAGEGGHLGREEIEVIEPVIQSLCACGLNLTGPVPADTAFVPDRLERADAVLAMYHDQGLPVLKHAGFGHAVNVTLGLPFVRTSVEHGTALDLAGTGRADPGSLRAAVRLARELVERNG
ncbi:MAG: 4-hydroxythreonine-4-phosphate dehydrogenase PdxA [Wenzhouxiangellaceae bacterium]|nr:4-hydroxythreonine-4-phosphate dehydrogenase PdxA [Wenzhouxiangellaceae bacterium]